jgi:hypothetical protein
MSLASGTTVRAARLPGGIPWQPDPSLQPAALREAGLLHCPAICVAFHACVRDAPRQRRGIRRVPPPSCCRPRRRRRRPRRRRWRRRRHFLPADPARDSRGKAQSCQERAFIDGAPTPDPYTELALAGALPQSWPGGWFGSRTSAGMPGPHPGLFQHLQTPNSLAFSPLSPGYSDPVAYSPGSAAVGGAPTALISRAGGPGHQDQATSEGVLHCSATARVRHWRELQLHSRLRSAAAGLLLRQAFRTVLLSWAARHLELPASLLASVGLLPGLSLFLSAGPEPVEWGVPHAGGPDWVDLIRAKNLHHHASLLTQQ